MDTFWHVTSYGYPNPFSDDKNAKKSWAIFQSFAQNDSYQRIKDHWESLPVPERLSAHSIESRKASFEEFGLLYVLTGSDKVEITPGGRQLIAAGEAGDQDLFAWIGINLLMRFPLQGPPRSRVTANVDSAFPIYNFLFSALCELQNFVWFEELIRVLGKVTNLEGARLAVEQVRHLRAGTESFDNLEPMPEIKGSYYNSMNQVLNHIGLAGLILTSERGVSTGTPYTLDRRDGLLSSASEIVRLAIGERSANVEDDDCVVSDQFINRMPTVPPFGTEEDYFRYLGAPVPDMGKARLDVEKSLPQVLFGQENVSVLTENVHYSTNGLSISGDVATLCRVSRGQRLILSHDLEWTYKVKDKQRVEGGSVAVEITRSKPISNPETILPHILENPDE